jgi:hypothetical protein
MGYPSPTAFPLLAKIATIAASSKLIVPPQHGLSGEGGRFRKLTSFFGDLVPTVILLSVGRGLARHLTSPATT